MEQIDLNGVWSLYYHVEDGALPENIEEVKSIGWPCLQAQVPGNVELDLCRNGVEGDPFYGQNLYDYKKYEFYQWWLEKNFILPIHFSGKQVLLKLHGLNTFGTIWINGKEVGKIQNMLVEHELDITSFVLYGGDNHIAIRIQSSVNQVRNLEYPMQVVGAEGSDEMVWLRMPPHSFGWDIAPRFLSAGIWRDIEIITREKTTLQEVYYVTCNIVGTQADLLIKYRFATDDSLLEGFTIALTGKCEREGKEITTFSKEWKAPFCSGQGTVRIPDAQLWWPRGYGEQNRYQVICELRHHGRVVDSRTETIGIRMADVKTCYEKGDKGEFQITINKVRILAKGSNWVPLDAFHSRDTQRVEKAVAMLADLECNITRCWGGNVYEDHRFYDLCDQYGILVWQDFSMACAIYPQNDTFADTIGKEAAFIVRKLRNHPSLLLWAGDNEIDSAYYWHGYRHSHAIFNRISREVLPRVVGSHDPYRPFIPSSPYIPEDFIGDSEVPEQHNWGPRDYFKGEYYRQTSAHFISEIGYHGCPAVSSIKKFIPPEKLWPYQDNEEWDTHNTEYIHKSRRGYNRNELMGDQVKILFGSIPDTLEEFAIASQISQAEAKKFFIEMVRLDKWRKTGLIWWNLLDCWPQFSDAVVDYYFTKKLAYHYIKRVQQPICLMMTELESWNHRIVLGNDSQKEGPVTYQVEDGDTGEILLQGTVRSCANMNTEVGSIRSYPGCQKLYLLKWEWDGCSHANHYISGYVPFDLQRYKKWLQIIEKLPENFESKACYQ